MDDKKENSGKQGNKNSSGSDFDDCIHSVELIFRECYQHVLSGQVCDLVINFDIKSKVFELTQKLPGSDLSQLLPLFILDIVRYPKDDDAQRHLRSHFEKTNVIVVEDFANDGKFYEGKN